MTIDRVPCCVPGCRRGVTAAAWEKRYGAAPTRNDEHICREHWRQVPKPMRRVHARIKRTERRIGTKLPAGDRIWMRLRRQVGAED